jgi:hypothetical protein
MLSLVLASNVAISSPNCRAAGQDGAERRANKANPDRPDAIGSLVDEGAVRSRKFAPL